MMLRAALLSSLVLLSGCSLMPQPKEPGVAYDFGIARTDKDARPRVQKDLVVAPLSAPAWLDNRGLYYRLGYQDITRPQAYALSSWVGSPAALLGQKLRSSIARASTGGVFTPADGVRTDYTLRLELEEFSQVFDAPDRSRAVLQLQASLIRQREVVAQQRFSIERPAATPNAEGGVRALIAASDAAGEALVEWLALKLQRP